MSYMANGHRFAELFRKYRLRSQIKTLAEFGDLLAEEGIIYENSLFTRWQNGERVPKDRRNLLSIIKIFCCKGGIMSVGEANSIFESSGQGSITEEEEFFVQQLLEKYQGNSTQSIGRLIKEFRINRNLSIKDVSLSLGWKDEKIYYGIENDLNIDPFSNPSHEVINKLINIFELNDEEKNRLLMIGNYLPTDEEIERILSYVSPIIEGWPYPAVVLDYTWRMIAENNKSKIVFYQSDNEIVKEGSKFPNVLEVIFNSDYIMNKQTGQLLDEWKKRQSEIVQQFLSEQKNRSKEKWYIELIQRMLDNQEFRSRWDDAHKDKMKLIVSHFGNKILPNPSDYKKKLTFSFFVVPIYNDPRFEIEFYTPSDLDTFNYYHEFK